MSTTPATTISSQFGSSPSNVVNFASSHAKALGIIQITLGILSIIFHIPSIVYQIGMYIFGHGIWCGIFYIIAGGLTLGAAKTKNKCMVIASLTLCIIASFAAGIQVMLGMFGCAFDIFGRLEYDYYDFAGSFAINTIIALFGLTAMIICIITSALSCKALCCSGTVSTEAPVQVMTLEDGRVVTAILMPTKSQGSSHTNAAVFPPAYDPIVNNEKKELI